MANDSYIYLASRSPRRREILEQAGIPYQLIDIEIDESVLPRETPAAYVQRLAEGKALAGGQTLPGHNRPLAPVLGSDTTVALDGALLGKPENRAQALDMLMRLSGNSHEVYTGVSVYDHSQHRQESVVVRTTVYFSSYTEQQALQYIDTGEPMDKAGAYGIQGFGGVLVKRIEGSYSSVVGLPIHETTELVRRFGVGCWQTGGNRLIR